MISKKELRADCARWRNQYLEAAATAARLDVVAEELRERNANLKEGLKRTRTGFDDLSRSYHEARDLGFSLESQNRDLKQEIYAAKSERLELEQSIRDLILLGVVPDRWLLATTEQGNLRGSVLDVDRLALDALALAAEEEREADGKAVRDAKKAISAHKG